MTLDVLPALLRRFRATHPDVTIDLLDLPSAEQAQAIAAGIVDVGFTHDAPVQPSLAWRLVRTEAQVVAMRREHPLAARKSVALVELRDEKFVMYPRDQVPGPYNRFVEACRSAGFFPQIVRETAGMFAIVGLVAMDVGIAIVPSVLRDVELGGVVFRDIEDGLAMDTTMVWDPLRLSPTVAAFVAEMREPAALAVTRRARSRLGRVENRGRQIRVLVKTFPVARIGGAGLRHRLRGTHRSLPDEPQARAAAVDQFADGTAAPIEDLVGAGLERRGAVRGRGHRLRAGCERKRERQGRAGR